MEIVNYILATAGHVDHGKSALVRALSGIDPDRLPEEKARGITIDLGFAHVDLPAPANVGQAIRYRVGIVDVPGHEDFVKNMVAGVGSIDMALLVVSAKDGWMPQTEEHLQILSYAGIKHAIVALTMADLVPEVEPTQSQVRRQLEGTAFATAPIVATSTVSGEGIGELKRLLAAELARMQPQRDFGKPRLAVDRAFTMRGAGTVVTGTLTGGVLRRGQPVTIEPGNKNSKIRSIQCYNRDVECAAPGTRVALNLPDLQVENGKHRTSVVSRGDVVTLPGMGRASDTIDVILEVSGRRSSAKPLKEGTRIRVHHGSGNFPACFYLLGTSALAPGDSGPAEFRFDAPVFALAGDRFIVRDWSEQHTLAGGMVLDPDASRRGFRTPERATFLRARADHPSDPRAFLISELERDGAALRSTLLLKSRFGRAEIERAAETLVADGCVLMRGDWLAAANWWNGLQRTSLEAIDAAHRSQPQEIGLRLTDLRQLLGKQAARAELFEALIEDLCRSGCLRAGVCIRRSSHHPALPPHLQPAGIKLRAALSTKPLEPPSRKELARDALGQQALRFFLQSGEAVEVGDDLVLHASGYQQAVETIRRHLRAQGAASVSELRQALNTSRRVMVPLLEKLDREGITLRQGDKRILRQYSGIDFGIST